MVRDPNTGQPMRGDPYEKTNSPYKKLEQIKKEQEYREFFKYQLVYSDDVDLEEYDEPQKPARGDPAEPDNAKYKTLKEIKAEQKKKEKEARQKTALELDKKGKLIDILYNQGRELDSDELKYQIEIVFTNCGDKTPFDDVLYLGILRMGFLRSAPQYWLQINIPPTRLEQMKYLKNTNKPVEL